MNTRFVTFGVRRSSAGGPFLSRAQMFSGMLVRVGVVALMTVAPGQASAWGWEDPLGSEALLESHRLPLPATLNSREDCPVFDLQVPLELATAIELAWCQHPQTQWAWSRVRQSAALLGAGKAAYLPTLTGSFGAAKGRGSMYVSGFTDAEVHKMANTSANAAINWLLYDFGKRSANVAAAEANLTAAIASADAAAQSVMLSTALVFFNASAAVASVAAVSEDEKAAEMTFQIAASRLNKGDATKLDWLQAKAELSQARLRKTQAEADRRYALGALAIQIGLAPTAVVQPAPSPLPENLATVSEKIDELMTEALREHPTLLAARAQLSAAQSKLQALKAEGMPALSLGGVFNRTRQMTPYVGQTITPSSDMINLTISMPLFEGGGRMYQAKAAEAEVDVQSANVALTEQRVALDIWKSYQELRGQVASLEAAADMVESAQALFDKAQASYRLGDATLLGLLKAQAALGGARQQRIMAIAGWHVARIRWATHLGTLGTDKAEYR